MKECVLVVDDDRDIVESVCLLLENEGYQCLKAYDGFMALDQITANQVHLIIMDVMMPHLDGLSTIMRIREKHNIPIIVLSAKTEDTDKVLGLSMGADDYMAKPFHVNELLARVKSHLRRYTSLGDIFSAKRDEDIHNGRLAYNVQEKTLKLDGEFVRLTATETKIMELFMRNIGKIFSAEEIYNRVWQEECFMPENTVMVHIRRIREKIEINPREPEYVKVVWGIGYKMEKK